VIHAAVLHAPGDIRVEQVAEPTAPAGHALVRVAAVGVCGSDLPRILTKGAHRLPVIPGHEFSGTIVAAEGVDLPVGQRVTVPPMIPCFRCDPCRRGAFSLCRDYSYFGSREDGAYSELVRVPATNLLPVPDGVDDVAAASVDPAAIALHAIWRAGLTAGERVAVVGAGPIGLFAVQWAQILGAGEVVALDVMEEKLELARTLGADVALDARAGSDLRGTCDLVVETAGVPSAENQAVQLAGPHGRVVFIGIPVGDVPLSLATFNDLLRNEVTVHGAWNSFSAPFPGPEWTVTVDMMARGRLRADEVVSHREPLERLPEMIAWMGDRRGFFSKVMFFPNGSGGRG
jgi:L-iditol 2-dehydrogenase